MLNKATVSKSVQRNESYNFPELKSVKFSSYFYEKRRFTVLVYVRGISICAIYSFL